MNSFTYQGKIYELDTAEISSLQIRALADVPASHTILIEGQGTDPDHVLNDKDVLDLAKGPIRLYSKPPTSFGVGNACPTR